MGDPELYLWDLVDGCSFSSAFGNSFLQLQVELLTANTLAETLLDR